MSQALRQLAQLKVKDVPNFAKENVTTSNISNSFQKWAHNYHQKYILTGSIKPLNDLLIYVGILSYAVGWPTELRHLRHAEEAAKHGGEHH